MEIVVQHTAYANGLKIFDKFIDCGQPMCPSTQLSKFMTKCATATVGPSKALLGLPWADLLSWAESADQAYAALQTVSKPSDGACDAEKAPEAAESSEKAAQSSGQPSAEKEKELAVVVPSFIVAWRYMKWLESGKFKASGDDDEAPLETKAKNFLAWAEGVTQETNVLGKQLRDRVFACTAFDQVQRREIETRCGILIGEPSVRACCNKASVECTKQHLALAHTSLEKLIQSLKVQKALQVLDDAKPPAAPNVTLMTAIRANPKTRDLVNWVACFRSAKKLFKEYEVDFGTEQAHKVLQIATRACAVIQHPVVITMLLL